MVQLVISTALRDRQFNFEAKDCLICKHCTQLQDAKVSESFVVLAYKIYCDKKETWIEHTGLFTNWCEEYEEELGNLDSYFKFLEFKLKD